MQWKSYLTFSKNERIGFLVFLVLMGIFLSAPYWLGYIISNKARNATIEYQLMQIEKDSSTKVAGTYPLHFASVEGDSAMVPLLKRFNPNALKAVDWIAMGIPEKTARTLQRYTEKGGRFRTASDLNKIWGMRASDVERLLPYVEIESTFVGYTQRPNSYSNNFTTTPKVNQPIDINVADSADWEALPGIGPVLAGRIIHYRTKCKGFQSVDAIRAVYGLQDAVFKKIEPFLRVNNVSLPPIQKQDLNQLTVTELQRVGMLSREVAQAIVLYRQQHGNYKHISDLRKLVLITDSLMSRIEQTMEVSARN